MATLVATRRGLGAFPDIVRYNIIDVLSYHYITFSRIVIFLYHFLTGDIFVI
jgi:hypothetical protein